MVKMKVFTVLIACMFFFYASLSFAAPNRFYLGAGATFFNMGKTTSSEDASTSLIGQVYLPLTLSIRMSLNPRISLAPFASYTPLAVKDSDEVSKRILTAGVNLAWRNSGKYDLKTGLGLLSYFIGSDGSAVTRSNGTGSSTFYLPSTTISSKSIFLNLGIGYFFHENLRLDLDAMVLSALSSARSFSSTISLNKGLF
jgi:hypothetical protein